MRRGSGTMSSDGRGSDEEGKRRREMGAGIDRFSELVDWSCTYADSEDSDPDKSELTEWHVHDWAGRCEEWVELNKLATQDESLLARLLEVQRIVGPDKLGLHIAKVSILSVTLCCSMYRSTKHNVASIAAVHKRCVHYLSIPRDVTSALQVIRARTLRGYHARSVWKLANVHYELSSTWLDAATRRALCPAACASCDFDGDAQLLPAGPSSSERWGQEVDGASEDERAEAEDCGSEDDDGMGFEDEFERERRCAITCIVLVNCCCLLHSRRWFSANCCRDLLVVALFKVPVRGC